MLNPMSGKHIKKQKRWKMRSVVTGITLAAALTFGSFTKFEMEKIPNPRKDLEFIVCSTEHHNPETSVDYAFIASVAVNLALYTSIILLDPSLALASVLLPINGEIPNTARDIREFVEGKKKPTPDGDELTKSYECKRVSLTPRADVIHGSLDAFVDHNNKEFYRLFVEPLLRGSHQKCISEREQRLRVNMPTEEYKYTGKCALMAMDYAAYESSSDADKVYCKQALISEIARAIGIAYSEPLFRDKFSYQFKRDVESCTRVGVNGSNCEGLYSEISDSDIEAYRQRLEKRDEIFRTRMQVIKDECNHALDSTLEDAKVMPPLYPDLRHFENAANQALQSERQQCSSQIKDPLCERIYAEASAAELKRFYPSYVNQDKPQDAPFRKLSAILHNHF